MSAPDSEELEHVLIDVDDDTLGVYTERVWAKPLGNNLFEVRNTPWHTCDVNWGDVVLAKSDDADEWPTFVKVERAGGHRTVHVFFLEKADGKKRNSILRNLKKWGANYENADDRLYAVDVQPEGDYQGLVRFLAKLEREGLLDYRTRAEAGPKE